MDVPPESVGADMAKLMIPGTYCTNLVPLPGPPNGCLVQCGNDLSGPVFKMIEWCGKCDRADKKDFNFFKMSL